jgi:hypothetical protein
MSLACETRASEQSVKSAVCESNQEYQKLSENFCVATTADESHHHSVYDSANEHSYFNKMALASDVSDKYNELNRC